MTGGVGRNNKKTEILLEGKWKQLQDYPYAERFISYAISEKEIKNGNKMYCSEYSLMLPHPHSIVLM